MTDNRITFALVAVVLLLAVGAYLFYDRTRGDVVYDPPLTVMPPPENNAPAAEWSLATTTEYSYRYPADLGMTYVDLVDWPPAVQTLDEAFSCTEGGEET